jgi:hypothetical protein
MGYCRCDVTTEPTNGLRIQYVIIVIDAGLFDDPVVGRGDAWITYVTARYINNNLIEGFESDFPD